MKSRAHSKSARLQVHELHLLFGPQHIEILVAIALDLAAAGRLHIDDAHDARIDVAHIDRTAGLERHAIAGIAELLQQRNNPSARAARRP